MSTIKQRPARVVTDSEDDQSDIRHHRDFSITSRRNDNAHDNGKKQRPTFEIFRHTLPIHTVTKASVLSKEAPPENYSGFIRLGMLVLGASNIRLIIENWVKYGLLIRFPHNYIPRQDYGLFVLSWLSIPVCLAMAFAIEKGMANLTVQAQDAKPDFRNKVAVIERVAISAHLFHLTFLVCFPGYIVYTKIYHPLVGAIALFNSVVMFLKSISFILVNREFRWNLMKGTKDECYEAQVQYPNNITVGNLLYFAAAPTLCYQPSYPRSGSFRFTFFLKRVGELVVCTVMMYILMEQYAKPTLTNSLNALKENNHVLILERVLKLSTTAVVIWLLLFYAFFHAYMNALSEVLCFGDRTFYLAWWNSGTLATYWRLWNRPVYLFFKRHVYIPAVRRGVPPAICQLLVFLASAVLHEVLVGIPTHAITGFAFWAMLGQIPLVALTQVIEKWRGKNSALGNSIFWITFCVIGQPTVALLYFHKWTETHKDFAPFAK